MISHSSREEQLISILKRNPRSLSSAGVQQSSDLDIIVVLCLLSGLQRRQETVHVGSEVCQAVRGSVRHSRSHDNTGIILQSPKAISVNTFGVAQRRVIQIAAGRAGEALW